MPATSKVCRIERDEFIAAIVKHFGVPEDAMRFEWSEPKVGEPWLDLYRVVASRRVPDGVFFEEVLFPQDFNQHGDGDEWLALDEAVGISPTLKSCDSEYHLGSVEWNQYRDGDELIEREVTTNIPASGVFKLTYWLNDE